MSKIIFKPGVMKKILLFILMAVAVNAIAQVKKQATYAGHAGKNPVQLVRENLQMAYGNNSVIQSMLSPAHLLKNPSAASSPVIQIMDSTYQWEWETDAWKLRSKAIDIKYDINNRIIQETYKTRKNNSWVDTAQVSYTYDANNNPLDVIMKAWDGSAWVNAMKMSQAYDLHNNQTSFALQNWVVNEWVDFSRFTWTYDANNNQTSQAWQGIGGMLASKYTWTYDARNNMTGELNELWDVDLQTWVNSKKSAFGYDANDNITGRVDQMWNPDLNTWEYTSKTSYTYDANKNLITEIKQAWNPDPGQWEDASRKVYTYDANNDKTLELLQTWDGTGWNDFMKYAYVYDANHNLLSELDLNWDGVAWVNSNRYLYTYNAGNKQTSELDQEWDGSAWQNNLFDITSFDANGFVKAQSHKEWSFSESGTEISGDSTHFYFHILVSGLNTPKNGAVSVYPNPGNGKFTLSGGSTITSVEVFNLAGKMVYADYNFRPGNSRQLDLTGCAKGVYILKINNGSKIQNSKLVIR